NITGTAGGNFESLVVGTGSATAHVNDTIDATTVDLSASTQLEGASSDDQTTALQSRGSQVFSTIHANKGDITIANGATTGTLTIPAGTGADLFPYTTLFRSNITGTAGGNFESLVVGTGSATAHVNDTIDATTVDLSASTQLEGA